jgi:transcriptional regulator with XRE-family HTH domain
MSEPHSPNEVRVYAEPTRKDGCGYPAGLAREDVPVEVIREAFHRSGLSMREVARRLRVHPSGVTRILSGRAAWNYQANAGGEIVKYVARDLTMSADRARRYAHALDVDPREWGVKPR